MAIEYCITLDDNHQFSYRIELNREYDPAQAQQAPAVQQLSAEP